MPEKGDCLVLPGFTGKYSFIGEVRMRVVSGKAKGTKLVAPKSERTRPTLDKTKEALFSVLLHMAPDMFGSGQGRCLDLCAGSGQVGIEALSRNMYQAVFVEKDAAALAVIKENLQKTHLTQAAQVVGVTVGRFFKMRQATSAQAQVQVQVQTGQAEIPELFDFIYCDPPYRLAAEINAAVLAHASLILRQGGVLVLEQAAEVAALPATAPLCLVKEQVYGRTRLCFYR
ncbi:16S rRNA (guanine(966)-N(2))-methyltransferase RsmD [Amygdalobacter indicium]|uniref:16S rRNA (guanine(966)-N(2))-methyltransferase RsmD n=1 Tax=Amygdalobacter indicium TaxID=3029272 RepID=UPI0027998E81|nr:16S rRNA (guanine(966)-N(2))-methyltransferase RsmD [Amygdalobacter indicium]WEG34304.1 16S rRNA (guanine(966)-N(2))-methyltransferase RsmD [Amygdalobacter indicium]